MCFQFGQLELNRLLLDDRGAESDPLLGIGRRLLERALSETNRHRRDPDPAAVECGQENARTLAGGAEECLVRHLAVSENELACIRGVPAELAVWLLGF